MMKLTLPQESPRAAQFRVEALSNLFTLELSSDANITLTQEDGTKLFETSTTEMSPGKVVRTVRNILELYSGS